MKAGSSRTWIRRSGSIVVDKKLTVDDLSPDQREVYDAMIGWAEGRPGASPYAITTPDPDGNYDGPNDGSRLLTVGGYAGCGKTTLLGVFAATTDLLCAYVTLTGRASSILRRKLRAAGAATTDCMRPAENSRGGGPGVDPHLPYSSGPAFVGTIHRLCYRPILSPEEEVLGWTKRTALDRKYDLIVIDEASMVSGEMLRDLQAYGVPILAVGDHGQLPPVMDSGELMKNPELRLEKIHRQAEGNPIIALAHQVRTTGRLGRLPSDGAVRGLGKTFTANIIEGALKDATSPLDVGVLCWMNRSRVQLNMTARKALGISGPPRKGEPLICLKNKSPVFNGMRGLLTEDSAEGSPPWILNGVLEFPDEGLPPTAYQMCAPQFCRETVFKSVEEMRDRGIKTNTLTGAGMFMDFGWAMTVHKSQGSSWPHVIFYVDRPVKPDSDDWRRFAYTAITRSAERLTIVL
jgi:exodeoxyribonuclease V